MLSELVTIKILSTQIKDNGSPHDRGMADSYYRRAPFPHKVVDGREVHLTPGTDEFQQYMDGYEYNEELGNFKSYGDEP